MQDAKLCPECGLPVRAKKNTFCSNKCSNIHKAKNVEYRKKLSAATKAFHSRITDKERSDRLEKISRSVKKTNSLLSKEERSEKYSNKTIRRTAFEDFETNFSDVEKLFDYEWYYREKYLPVRCKECGFEWEMTKTTTISRTVCTKCHPHKKHKTQTEIFDFVNGIVSTKENAKDVISNEIDVYVESMRLGIEYNGLLPHSFGPSTIWYYNSDAKCIDRTYHLRKTEECEENEIQLLHVFENEFLNKDKRKIWYSLISNKLGRSRKIFARKCKIKEINARTARSFLEKNHMQGSCLSSIKLGLFYNEELVSVMTFRKHRKYQWELARFCTVLGTTVIGGASKLLKRFEKKETPKSLLSFANRRWSTGTLYEKLGFTFTENTPPNYFYFKINENILYPRETFQKHKLGKILEKFDPRLSETQNMFNNGYRVIFDSGNKKYVKTY